jgi:hypothetical protein
LTTIRLFAIVILLQRLARELMSDPMLRARYLLLDERRHRATLVTADPLELRPGAGVENELSAQLGAIFAFQMTLAAPRLPLGVG